MQAKKAGYEYLLAYKITIPIYDYTVIFCKRCQSPNYSNFPSLSSTRTFDQMIQAARSGTMNIAEEYQKASLQTYISMVGVNRASLEELLKDLLAYARQNGILVWTPERVVREVREVGVVWWIIRNNPYLPDHPNFPDLPQNPTHVINLLITLTNQAIYLQRKLQKSLEEKFVKEGGFRENLFKKRMEFKRNN